MPPTPSGLYTAIGTDVPPVEGMSPSFSSPLLNSMDFNLSPSTHAARSISPTALQPLRHASASSPPHPLSYPICPFPSQPLRQAFGLAPLEFPFPFDFLCAPPASLLLNIPSPRSRLHFTANLFFRPTHLGLVSPLVPLPGRPRPSRRHSLRLTAPSVRILGRLPPLSRITVPRPVARECLSHPLLSHRLACPDSTPPTPPPFVTLRLFSVHPSPHLGPASSPRAATDPIWKALTAFPPSQKPLLDLPLLAASLLHPPSFLVSGSPSLASDFFTVHLLALSASLRHFLAHPPLPSMLPPLSFFDLPLRLQSAHPPLALRTLHALRVSPFGGAEALLPLALPTFCSHSLVFTSVSLWNSSTFNPSTWPCRTGTVSSPILACPRRSSPLLTTSTLSLPSDVNFGTATARLLTAGSDSSFVTQLSTRPSRSMPLTHLVLTFRPI